MRDRSGRSSPLCRGRWGARLILALVAGCVGDAHAREAERWEELFFPYAINVSSPTLSHYVAFTPTYFRGDRGSGFAPTLQLAQAVTRHLGLQATIPIQLGWGGQASGFEDITLDVEYLAAGSLRYDNLLSVGATASFPTGGDRLGNGDYFVGAFVNGGQRFLRRRIVLEGNVAALVPIVHGATARQLGFGGLLAILVTPQRADFPLPFYVEMELNSTVYLDGTSGLPSGAKATPTATLALAPEIFFGPFSTRLSDTTRVSVAVFFSVVGDPAHAQTFAASFAFNIPK